jgi:integrase
VIWDPGGAVSAKGQAVSDRTRMTATFDTYAEAKTKLATVEVEKPKPTVPFKELTDHFLDHFQQLVDKKQREASSHAQLRQHIELHILTDAQMNDARCAALDAVFVQLYFDRLVGRVSFSLAVKIRATLSRVCDHGVRRGFMKSNPVAATKIERTRRPEAGAAEHFELPPKRDLKKLLAAADRFDNIGRARAAVNLLMFAGLRISELRGLLLEAAQFTGANPKVKVVRRADRYNKMGPVKSAAGLRTLELGLQTAAAVQEYLQARSVDSDLVFPNDEGKVWDYPNLWNRFWVPLMNEAGLVTDEAASYASKFTKGRNGYAKREPSTSEAAIRAKAYRERLMSPADKAKRAARERNLAERLAYKQPAFGLHMLRHVYASLQIEQGVTPKRLQKLMGHATLKLTLDTYGHLWPDESADRARAKAVENAL